MKAIELLEAISQVDDGLVWEVTSDIGRDKKRKTGGYKKALRTILIAAVITALLGAAAYAAGWFGLWGLRIGRSQYGADILSLQGLADSPEAKGAAEWREYYEEHKNDSYDPAEAQSYYEKYGLLGCNTPEAAAKAAELCQKYELSPLGEHSTPDGEKAFYEAAGTGRLATDHGSYVNTFYSGYVYPQGTFKFEGMISPPDKDYGYLYGFHRAMKGTLDDVAIHTDADAYDEWDYVSQGGTTLHLANSDVNSLIILDTRDAFIVVSFMHEGFADHLGDGLIDGIGDEWLSFTVSREELESAAECFDWLALEDAARGMDGEFKSLDYSYDGPSAADTVELEEDVDLSSLAENDLYFIKLAYRDSIAPYISGFELIDYSLNTGGGWIEFLGTPRTALDWEHTAINGRSVYCRSLNFTSAGEGQWQIENAFDMLPYEYLSNYENIGTDVEPDSVYVGTELTGLVSASLYVQQTGKTYTIASPEGIEQVKAMLRFNDIMSGVSECETWNPLYLRFDDGRSRVVYTTGDGSNSVHIYGGSQPYSLGLSIFELFGVPLEAAGYSSADGITTTHADPPPTSMLAWVEYDYESGGKLIARRICEKPLFGGEVVRSMSYEYDGSGNLILEHWYDENGNVSTTREYEYNAQGKLTKRATTVEKLWELTEYIYDNEGRLIMEKYSSPEHPNGNDNASVYYDYDAAGNCRISMGWEKQQNNQ